MFTFKTQSFKFVGLLCKLNEKLTAIVVSLWVPKLNSYVVSCSQPIILLIFLNHM